MLARSRRYILVFAALAVIYSANLRPVDSSDTLPGSLIPLAIVLDHSVTLDRFVPWLRQHVSYTRAVIVHGHGHSFSQYPIGGPVLVSPLYWPIALLLRLSRWNAGALVMFARIAEKFAAVLITALSAVILLLLLERITSRGWALCLSLVYALGTSTWSISSQALWQHGPGELAICGALLGLSYWSERRNSMALWICGACAGSALIFRPTNIVLLPALFVAMVIADARIREHLYLWTPLLVAGCLIAGYNFYVFRHVSGGHSVGGLSYPLWAGLAGILFSPGRGLLIYTPIAVFALCAFWGRARTARQKNLPLFTACIAFVPMYVILIAKWRIWWGGYSWGPRLLTEIAPALIVLMAIGVSVIERPWPRRAFAVLAAYAILIQAVGVFFYPKGHWDAGPPNINRVPKRAWDWVDNPIARTIRGGLYWEPYAVVGAALSNGIPAAQQRMRELNANPYDESPPEGDSPRQ